MPRRLGGGTMVAMGGWRPPWLVGASLTFPLNCSIANYYSHLRSFWYKKKKRVITHLEQVNTRQREKINRFGNCSNSVVLQLTHLESLFNCELKPAHAFGVDSRKSFEVRFTIG
jgi:hypothetical protein